MAILYLTDTIKPEDYDFLVKKNINPGNPSHQNFHSRLIKALATVEDVVIYSLAPRTGSYRLLDSSNYHYIEREACPLFRGKAFKKEVKKLLKENNFSCVITDNLSLTLNRVISSIAKGLTIPLIILLTDSPIYFQNVPSYYINMVKKTTLKGDAFIALNKYLLSYFNVEDKPHLVINGIANDDEKLEKISDAPYFYYGGTFLPRYGINNVLNAFIKSNAKYNFYLAGHHLTEDIKKLQKQDPRIKYLGQVSEIENLTYINNASLVINPRPKDEELLKYSFPSKLLEYMTYGKAILTVANPPFTDGYKDSLNLLKDGKEEDFTSFFKEHLDQEGHLKDVKLNKDQTLMKETFGLNATGKKIEEFIKELNKDFEDVK